VHLGKITSDINVIHNELGEINAYFYSFKIINLSTFQNTEGQVAQNNNFDAVRRDPSF
jgi:hypothetical protein